MTPDDVRDILARNLPGGTYDSVVPIGSGVDNVGYEVDGELIVRISRVTDPTERAEVTRREAALLAVVGELSPVPVPEPIFADPDAGALGYRKLPGVPLLDRPVADPTRLAAALAGFLSRLHRPPPSTMHTLEALLPQDVYPMPAWRDEAEAAYRSAVERRIPPEHRRLVEAFLAAEPPPEPDVLTVCHNDLGAEHLLADAARSTLTGVLDWTDAALADPAVDFGRIFRDLGPGVLHRAVAGYTPGLPAAARKRAVFYARCTLLEDVTYGVESGDGRYIRAALANLPRTFTRRRRG